MPLALVQNTYLPEQLFELYEGQLLLALVGLDVISLTILLENCFGSIYQTVARALESDSMLACKRGHLLVQFFDHFVLENRFGLVSSPEVALC